jgi:TonB-dependent SusC/RagA subfamily outer membrane receptor
MATTWRTAARAAALRASLALPLAAACAHPRAAGEAAAPPGAGAGRSLVFAADADRPWAVHVAQLLQGRAHGVDVRRLPDGRFDVRVRGAGAPGRGEEPLYVVDGLPLASGPRSGDVLEGIDPADVARIDVLRGSAAAVYGQRGAHGVIVITLRRGRR